MLAFVDWSSTGTHYQVGAIFQMLPYQSCTVLLKHILELLATAISFTIDIWTSDVSPMSMLSLTAQWVVEYFVLRKVAMHAHECAGCHTIVAISMTFDNMFET